MQPDIGGWLNLLVRWTHVITGIAWIGTSFFFMWLDSHLAKPTSGRSGVEGELWMVHSGGFYQVDKVLVAPERLPGKLHWFIWEATFTWITGFLLLVIVYYMGSGRYLVDPSAGIGVPAATAIGIGSLAVAWFVYDAIWQKALGRGERGAAVLSFLLLMGAAFGLSQALSGRAAYLHVGALLGTLMAANVWVRIIPAQRQLVTARETGTAPDPAVAASAKRRSVHNNYMTLPVVFVMISSHFPFTYGHAWNWLVLVALFLVGVAVRHTFNLRNRGQRSGWLLPAAAVAVGVLVFVTAPARSGAPAGDEAAVPFDSVRVVIAQRCVACHSETTTSDLFPVAPNGVFFDTPMQIVSHAGQIYERAVVTRTMPLANDTRMTDGERDVLRRWFEGGARIR